MLYLPETTFLANLNSNQLPEKKNIVIIAEKFSEKTKDL